MEKKTSAEVTDKQQKTADGFVNFISRLGINPANPQSNLNAGRYTFNLLTRNRLQLEAAYRGSWLVGQMIDSVAEDMTRAGINITSSEAADHIQEMQASLSRLQIFQSICSEVKWSRLYGGAIAVMQIDGQKLDTPLDPETISLGQFKGLVVYDRWQVNPDLSLLIQSGPNMGLPLFYEIITGWKSDSTTSEPTANGTLKVHHSRCIRMIGIELPFFQAITEMMWGESFLERVWDRLISFDDTTLSAANLVDRAQLRTVGVDDLREIIAAGGPAYEGLVQMFEMVRQFQTNEGITLLDKNDVFQTTSYSFAGLSDILLQFGQQVSGAAQIPLVRLFGQSPAGLNATGEADIRMYYDNILAQQESKLRNPLEVLLKVLYRSLFGIPAPKDLQFTFVPLWQMSAMDKATIAKTNTETIIAAHQEGAIDTPTMMEELRHSSGDHGLFTNITDEQIEEAKMEPPMLGETLPEITQPAVKNIDHASEVSKTKRMMDKIKAWVSG